MRVAPGLRVAFAHLRHTGYLELGASHLNFDEEGWAPYAIFGMFLGLLPVFGALVISRLPI